MEAGDQCQEGTSRISDPYIYVHRRRHMCGVATNAANYALNGTALFGPAQYSIVWHSCNIAYNNVAK